MNCIMGKSGEFIFVELPYDKRMVNSSVDISMEGAL